MRLIRSDESGDLYVGENPLPPVRPTRAMLRLVRELDRAMAELVASLKEES